MVRWGASGLGRMGEGEESRGEFGEFGRGARRREGGDECGGQDVVHSIQTAGFAGGYKVHCQRFAGQVLGALGTIILNVCGKMIFLEKFIIGVAGYC
mmetsp:Transcript_14832/g.19060  ORF Transcript_14832/g.19060 Transcript_14832/m.19060 type:complete len:97 (+) Transcript_14832:284-574(+)